MKVLHIVRHAAAVGRNPDSSDFDRALTKKGVKAALAVARRLRKSGFTVDHMISSPAVRALETAKNFAQEMKYSVKRIELQKMIYDTADNDSLLSLVRNIPAKVSDALIFGHDPSFSGFSQYLLKDFDESLPKGAVVTVGFETDSWADAGPGCARLLRYDYPMNKREKERRIELLSREIAASLTLAMNDQLRALDPRTAKKLRLYILKRHKTKKLRSLAERYLEMAPHFRLAARKGKGEQRRDEKMQPAPDS